jgi:hypothetical protein
MFRKDPWNSGGGIYLTSGLESPTPGGEKSFSFKLLDQRQIDKRSWVCPYCFTAQTFQQSLEAIDVDVDIRLQLLEAVGLVNLGQNLRVGDAHVFRKNLHRTIRITSGS